MPQPVVGCDLSPAFVDLFCLPSGKLDRRIAGLIAEDRPLAEQARLLSAVPGIGPTVLATLLGELPELGTLCRRWEVTRKPPCVLQPRHAAAASS